MRSKSLFLVYSLVQRFVYTFDAVWSQITLQYKSKLPICHHTAQNLINKSIVQNKTFAIEGRKKHPITYPHFLGSVYAVEMDSWAPFKSIYRIEICAHYNLEFLQDSSTLLIHKVDGTALARIF